MSILPPSLRGDRPKVAFVLSLVALSALAAGHTSPGHQASTASVRAVTTPTPAITAVPTKASVLTTPSVPVLGAVANVTTTPGWVSIGNKGLQLQAGTVTSDAPSAQPLRLDVSLRLRDYQGLQAYIKSAHTPGSPIYGQVLTTAQFNATYAPTAAQAQAVSDYLAKQGFRNIQIASNRVLVSAIGTAGLAETAFNTHLVNFNWQGKQQYLNTTDGQVPTALGNIVLSVFGLNNVPAFHLHHRKLDSASLAAGATPQAAGPAATRPGYTAPQFATAYDADSMPPAYGTTIAISTGGDDLSAVVAALRVAERITKRPPIPIKIVNTMPVPATASVENDEEWALDSQSSTGLAENVNQLIFYNAVGIADITTFNQFAADNIARVANLSVGGCESLDVALGGVAADEQAFSQAVAQGQTWFVSSGDEGSACAIGANTGTPAGLQDVEYPASSPMVVGVGGTELMTDANFTRVAETAWFGGGGGMSNFFAPPSWQSAAGVLMPTTTGSGTLGGPTSTATGAGALIPPNTITGTGGAGVPASEGGNGRGVPDVAMSADPYSGLNLFYDDIVITIGGTSLAAPLSVGSYARIQTAHCNTLGFAAPLFYSLDTTKGQNSAAAGFTDITGGTNGVYMAGTGWDYATGFGAFDVAAVSKALPAAAGCKLNQRPVAVLSADHTAGNMGLSVVFSGTGATDPDGDQIVGYAIDYGDDSDFGIQTTPVFPAHAYPHAGTYNPLLYARDSAGNFSLPVSLPITVYGVPQSCTAPGKVVGTSPPGVNPGTENMDIAMGEDDLTSVSVAEPSSLTDQLVFTIKVANLSATPTPMPGLRWSAFFDIPEDSINNYYVSMVSSNGPAPVFEYGTRTLMDDQAKTISTFNALGTLDATSNFTADGTITLVLNKSALKLQTGDVLTRIAAQVAGSAPTGTTGGVQLPSPAGQQDNAGQLLSYTLLGNAVCASEVANPPSGPTNGGGTTGPATGGMPTSGTTTVTTPTSGSGGTTPTPGSTPSSASNPPDTGLSPIAPTATASAAGNDTGRGGAGALGWLVLLPLSAGALRRRKQVKTRSTA